jgi:hypothetical protein
MGRRIKESVDFGTPSSLDDLIEKLTQLRGTLPDKAEAELKLKGDDLRGRHVTISYFREQTREESESEKR